GSLIDVVEDIVDEAGRLLPGELGGLLLGYADLRVLLVVPLILSQEGGTPGDDLRGLLAGHFQNLVHQLGDDASTILSHEAGIKGEPWQLGRELDSVRIRNLRAHQLSKVLDGL